jgi:hypothetical protein
MPRIRLPLWFEIVIIAAFVSLLISILLPARSSSGVPRGNSNLSKIFNACGAHAASRGGRLPLTLQTLVVDGSIEAQSLVWYNTGNRPPGCDYFYVSGLNLDTDPPASVVAYLDPALRAGRRTWVLYLSGEVDIVTTRPNGGDFKRLLAETVAAYEAAHGEPPVIVAPIAVPGR